MTKRVVLLVAAALCLPAMFACGKKPSASAADETDLAALQLAGGDGADEAGETKPEKLNCPLTGVSLPKTGADIRGISAGAKLDQAILYVKCQDRKTPYDTVDLGEFFENGAPGARQLVRLTDGGAHPNDVNTMSAKRMARSQGQPWDDYTNVHNDYHLLATGPKGAETVAGIWYTQKPDSGNRPTFADSTKALIGKYGPPSSMEENPGGTRLQWISNPSGQKMSKADPNFGNCWISPSFTGHLSLNPACGQVISALVLKAEDNELMAGSIAVALINPAEVSASLDHQQQVNETANSARKQAEAQAAHQNGPNL